MKTGSLHFSSKLKKPDFSIDTTPFISLGLVALFFLFASHSLFVSPGLAIDLIEIPEEHLAIPSQPPNAVLTLYSPTVFFFEGENLNPQSLEQAIRKFVQNQPEGETILLLVRVNRILSLEQVSPILNILEKAGIHHVVLEAQNTATRSSTP